MDLHVKLLGDASKNVGVWARGRTNSETGQLTELLDAKKLAPDPNGKHLRTLSLVNALWTLQEKLGLYVWTSQERKPENLLLIMESRNFIRFDRDMSLDDWQGKLYLESFGIVDTKWFWFQLEFDKVLER
jgi:hypothetical protein